MFQRYAKICFRDMLLWSFSFYYLRRFKSYLFWQLYFILKKINNDIYYSFSYLKENVIHVFVAKNVYWWFSAICHLILLSLLLSLACWRLTFGSQEVKLILTTRVMTWKETSLSHEDSGATLGFQLRIIDSKKKISQRTP